jgi:hypothetical protein
MITADRVNRLIIASLLCISLFLLLDCYVFPLETSKGVIVIKTEQKVSRLRVTVFRVETEKNTLTVPPLIYNNTRVNDTIEIGRSYITHVIQKMAVYGKDESYRWRIGFVSSGGLDFLVFLIIANGSYLFYFYRKLTKPRMQRELTIFLLFVSSIFFLFYFLFE